MKNYFLPIPVIFFMIGCNLLGSNDQSEISIKTDKNHYNLNENDLVKVMITNKSSEAIYYSTCALKEIETLKNDMIINHFGPPICYCLCAAELKPCESIPVQISSLSTEIFKTRMENLMPEESVTYRLRYFFYYDEAFGDEPVSPEFSRSNTFTISEN